MPRWRPASICSRSIRGRPRPTSRWRWPMHSRSTSSASIRCTSAARNGADGEMRYILAPVGLNVGDRVVSGPEADIQPGNALPLANIPLGTTVHNIELKPGRGGQVVRSAGMSAQLLAREGDYAQIRMPSGEVRRIAVVCYATVGQIGNVEHENENVGKAGKSRWRGKRPAVRGMTM